MTRLVLVVYDAKVCLKNDLSKVMFVEYVLGIARSTVCLFSFSCFSVRNSLKRPFFSGGMIQMKNFLMYGGRKKRK